MRSRWSLIFCMTLITACSARQEEGGLSLHGNQGVIYGDNSVRSPRHLTGAQKDDEQLQHNLQAGVALVDDDSIDAHHDGTLSLDNTSVSERFNVCPGQPLASQPSASFCSGVLVDAKHILTAGHCLSVEHACENLHVVFNYDKADRLHVAPQDHYHCRSSAPDASRPQADLVLVELDRPVQGHRPVEISTESLSPGVGKELYVIGHPLGAPQKIATGQVRKGATAQGLLLTNLDVFFGNSGSPVFEQDTDRLIGLVSSGESDFRKNDLKSCLEIKVCTNGGCLGETVDLLRAPGNSKDL